MVSAFCFTLLHSLWQGLVFAVITGLVMVLTRSSRAALRYNCLVLLFCGFLLTTGVTFWLELSSHLVTTNQQPVTSILQLETGNQELVTEPVTGNQHTLWERWADYFTIHASLVVLVWCILFCARLVQLLASLGYIQRVKHYKTHTPTAYWNGQLAMLAARLRLQKRVSLLESGIIKVPMVVGYLKPVILVPLGLLASLPADELEAILLHELAHIQRRDYLVNLLQSFVQAIFFFNPAIIWISALIREERENCCDDIAIAATNNRKQFVKALVAFQEYNLRNTAYAMAFPGKKQHLLNRVKRIIHNRNKTLNTMEKSVLSLGIAAAIVFSLASARTAPPIPVTGYPLPVTGNNQQPGTGNKQLAISSLPPITFHRTRAMIPPAAMQTIPVMNDTAPALLRDTIPVKNRKTLQPKGGSIHTEGNGYASISTNIHNDEQVKITRTDATSVDGTHYTFTKVNGNLAELAVNGEPIQGQDYKNYYPAIGNIEMAQHRKTEDAMARHRADQQQQRQNQEEKRRNIALQAEMRKQQQLQRQVLTNLSQQHLLSDQELLEQQKQVIQLKRQRDSLSRVIDQAIRRMSAMSVQKGPSDTTHISPKAFRAAPAFKVNKTIAWQNQWQRDSIAHAIKAEKIKEREAADKVRIEAAANTIRSIIADLAKDNIVVDIDHSWFGLDNQQFIVDGKPVNGEIYEKFKAKYLKKNGMGYYYGPVQINGRGIFLDKETLGK